MSSYRCLLTWLFDVGALLGLSRGGLGLCYFLQRDGAERGRLHGPECEAEIGGFSFRSLVLHPCEDVSSIGVFKGA